MPMHRKAMAVRGSNARAWKNVKRSSQDSSRSRRQSGSMQFQQAMLHQSVHQFFEIAAQLLGVYVIIRL